MKSVAFQYGLLRVVIETGLIARQANAAVTVRMGDTVVLGTLCAAKEAIPGRDFFPLTVNYQEKFYASGRIPGGYFKREGRPTERETLICRLIDRPLRPLFREGFKNDVQIVVTVLSLDPEIETDIPAMIAASAVASLSGLPFDGPIGAARVGYLNGEYVLNPAVSLLKESELDLVVAGTQKAVLMVESEAKQLSEEIMLNAVYFGHRQMQVVIQAINELKRQTGSTDWNWQAAPKNVALIQTIKQRVEADLRQAYKITEKMDRYSKISALQKSLVESLVASATDENAICENEVKQLFHALEKDIVRGQILAGEPRIDGRDTRTVRPIHVEVGVLPRTHGSALFTRGETQALVVSTLGTDRDCQMLDTLWGEDKSQFMLHYNFPPYSVGETGMMMGPKRREIGHGRLAKRSIQAVLPTAHEFPYVLRVVSEITESNGSSSMASVCGASLSLMDAGVPLKAPVAGIAMGLIKDEGRFAILTDILGDEDHLGDMDFKVAGTSQGITALQMDIKTDGITRDIMQAALAQALEGRLHILSIMADAMTTHRSDVSNFAPRITTIYVNPEKIRDIIGKGGATIRALTEETKTSIDIDDNGEVRIAAVNADDAKECQRRIEMLVAEAEVGKVYEGVVTRLMDFGALVGFLNGSKQGLVHISQISDERVESVADFLAEGQEVKVRVLEIDRQGRIRLSIKEVNSETQDDDSSTHVDND